MQKEPGVEQRWFEMPEIRRRKLEGAVWVPLRAISQTTKEGRYGYLGHLSEFYGVGTLAVAIEDKAKAEKLGWSDVGILHNHSGGVENGKYVPCDVRPGDYDGVPGTHLVLDQRGNGEEHSEWHLHQDLAITLRLKREGDTWVSLDEGYIAVAKLERDADGLPRLLSVRASHLKDYLCARGMALYVTSYRQRMEIVADASHITWPTSPPYQELTQTDRWEGRVMPIHEGGMPYGEKTAVFHTSRTDVDPKEDVPTMLGLPDEASVKSSSWTVEDSGRKLFVVEGEMWRREWVNPAPSSPIVRRDKTPATVYFITDGAGKQETRDTLADGGRWLWFRPEVVMALAHRRGGVLGWYTKNTGSVACAPGSAVHFGINALGLVNVYAKDIAILPDWEQKIWAGHNIAPDGGVSDELLASQAEARPARTQAPERVLGEALKRLGQVLHEKAGIVALRPHRDIPDLLRCAHRFRAIDQAGLLSLAKDLARLTGDSFDAAAIQTRVRPPDGEKWGSLKSLEHLLATQVGAEAARALMGPLFGIYELRLADAHLSTSELDEALEKAGVDKAAPYVVRGYQLLHACVGTLYAIIKIVEEWKDQS